MGRGGIPAIHIKQFKPNTTDQSRLVNALHLSAVERSDKVGCHSAKAAQTRLSSEKQWCRFLFRKTESKCRLWRQEAFRMLNYFHYVFSDAY